MPGPGLVALPVLVIVASGILEALHDGSYFGGEIGQLGLFLPAGIALLVMWLTGMWRFVSPLPAKRRRRRQPPQAMRRAA